MKKLISAVLAATILIISAVIPVGAAGGFAGDVWWSIDGTTLTVSGGDIPDYTASAAAPWLKYARNVTALVIGDDVGRIGDRAFEDMISLKSVDFGEVSEMGEMAFSGCTALTEIVLSDSVKEVDSFAFAECTSLTSVTIPPLLSYLGEGAFEACSALSSFVGGSRRYRNEGGVLIDTIWSTVYRCPPALQLTSFTAPEGITTVTAGAFRDCTALESVDLAGVTDIGGGAFYGCAALAAANISDARNIGRAAFYGTALKEIKFGEELANIGGSAFAFSTALATADFAGDAPAAGDDIFYGCAAAFTVTVSESSQGFGESEWMGYPLYRHGVYSGELQGICWSIDSRTGLMTVVGDGAIPDFEYASDAPWYEYRRLIRSLEVSGITEIGANSFRYSALREVRLPESVTRIGEWAFSGCASLQSVTADGVRDIGGCAFFACTSLSVVQIRGVQSIGRQAFSGSSELDYVIMGKVAPVLGEYVFDGTSAAVLYPAGGEGYSGGEWDNIHAEQYLAGDVNGDGSCNIADASHLLKYVAGWDVTVQKLSADTNCDGKLNITDVSGLLKYIAGWDIVICIG